MAPRKPPQALVNSAAMSRSASSSSASAKLASTSKSAIAQLWSNYQDGTSARLKLIDTFLLFLMLTGVSCFAYCVLITDFPFNAFLAAFAACVGQFVLLASLRAQVNPENKSTFPTISPERAFADFAFASIILHGFVFNFLG